MRVLIVASLLAVSASAFAADLEVSVDRNGFTGPVTVAIAPRAEGHPPEWSSPKTLGKTSVTFTGLSEGLYVVLVSGPQPLQRLSAKANVGANGSLLRLAGTGRLAFFSVFGSRSYTAHMLGENRLYAFAASRCLT